jgi:hypothetical protein
VASLRDRWEFNLYQAKDDVEPMWDHIVQVKVLAAGGHL